MVYPAMVSFLRLSSYSSFRKCNSFHNEGTKFGTDDSKEGHQELLILVVLSFRHLMHSIVSCLLLIPSRRWEIVFHADRRAAAADIAGQSNNSSREGDEHFYCRRIEPLFLQIQFFIARNTEMTTGPVLFP